VPITTVNSSVQVSTNANAKKKLKIHVNFFTDGRGSFTLSLFILFCFNQGYTIKAMKCWITILFVCTSCEHASYVCLEWTANLLHMFSTRRLILTWTRRIIFFIRHIAKLAFFTNNLRRSLSSTTTQNITSNNDIMNLPKNGKISH